MWACKQTTAKCQLLSFYSDVQSGIQIENGWPAAQLLRSWQNSGRVA